MDIVKVNKNDVLSIIKKNRKKHADQYNEAIKAYRVKVGDLFAKELQKVVDGEDFTIHIQAEKPVSHVKDYNLAVRMFELSVDEVVELNMNEFNQLINDEWNWQSSFRSSVYSNSSYSGTSGFHGTSGSSGTSYIYEVTFSDNDLENTFDD
jgi:hypothetical protein